jgi:hypothetical protein
VKSSTSWLVAAALVVGILLASPGLTDENAVSLQGDMPRYLMNGVFISDALRAGIWTPSEAIEFAQRYFARYPALSLGHHPPVLPVVLVPFFEIFGPSVFAGRVAILVVFLVSIVLVHRVARRLTGAHAASWASLVFATMPLVVDFGQQVLSEMPAIALVLTAMLFLLRFRDAGRPRDFLCFVAAALAGLACRQTVAFVFPAYAIILVRRGGLRQLRQPIVLGVTLAGVIGIVGAAIATMILSPFNTEVVKFALGEMTSPRMWAEALRRVLVDNHTPALFALAVVGLALGILRRDGRIMPAVWWLASVLVCAIAITGTIAPVRYSVIGLPALAIVAASIASDAASVRGRLAAAAALGLVVAMQIGTALSIRPVGASGYEAAAEFVLAEAPATPVLYSASVDTGYFTFFVRKHDTVQRSVVIRSDKLLTTSNMADISFNERIRSREEIYPLLNSLGIRFVVLEDRPSGSRVIDWLRDEVRTARFAERRRFATNSRDARLKDVSVVAYEYLDARAPAPDAVIELSLPLVDREIRVPLADLLAR